MKLHKGGTTVEFALVFIFFITFFLGVVDFARMLWTWNAASEATRWGARVSVVCKKVTNKPFVVSRMQKFLPTLTDANVTVNWYNVAGAVDNACTAANCAGVAVSITALNYKWLSPVGYAIPAGILMPGFSTYLPRESMGQDPNSDSVCT